MTHNRNKNCFGSFELVWENRLGRSGLESSLHLWGESERTKGFLHLQRGKEKYRKCLVLSVCLEKDRTGFGGDCPIRLSRKGPDRPWTCPSISEMSGQVLEVTDHVCLSRKGSDKFLRWLVLSVCLGQGWSLWELVGRDWEYSFVPGAPIVFSLWSIASKVPRVNGSPSTVRVKVFIGDDNIYNV